jgi:dihydrofolate reductase
LTTIAHIVAMARNRVIGVDNQLPWHLPEDLRHFKAKTMGKPIVMGRKTWESIGRPLPGRDNIVVTRQAGFQAEGAYVCATPQDAIALAEQFAQQRGVEELLVIGGAQLYRETLPLCQHIYLTEVDCEIVGDADYPKLDHSEWRELSRERHFQDGEGNPDYSFVELCKKEAV